MYEPFGIGHATYYDEFHRREKPYEAECDFVEATLARFGLGRAKRILDLGCGTGGHVIGLTQRGYQVTGVDSSAGMLEIARQSAAQANIEVDLRLAMAETVDLGQTFDCVVSFYNVINYFVDDDDVARLLANVRKHLGADGLFVFDYRNAFPAVTKYSPQTVHELQQDGRRVILISHNSVDVTQQLFLSNYEGFIFEGDRLIERFEEQHRLRVFVPREIAFHLKMAGFRILHTCAFPHLDDTMDASETWHVAVVATPIGG